jgi:hypothetical protein
MNLFDVIRRVVIFLLGILVIIDGLYGPDPSIPELVIGMVMVGIMPISDLPFLKDRDREHGEKGTSSSGTRDSS